MSEPHGNKTYWATWWVIALTAGGLVWWGFSLVTGTISALVVMVLALINHQFNPYLEEATRGQES